MSNWTRPADLRSQVERLWHSGRLLSSTHSGEQCFPRKLTLKGPSPREVAEHFGEVRAWASELRANARHYRLVEREVNNRVLGANSLPAEAWVDSREQALSWIGKRSEASRFEAMAALAREQQPELLAWLERRPLKALGLASDWPRLLAVVDWLRQNPRPGVYLRQVDIPGVDTKFIERHKGVLAQLFDLVLESRHIEPEFTGAAGFVERYGFRDKPRRIRFRLLDPALSPLDSSVAPLPGSESVAPLHGSESAAPLPESESVAPLPESESVAPLPGSEHEYHHDLTLTAQRFAALRLPAARVFITENEINFLAFPSTPGSIVILGGGFALDSLREVAWLRDRDVHYWGDIDTHGFAILNRLRSWLPTAKSLLMDRETFLAHRGHWGSEPAQETRDLERLDPEEAQLYDDLRCNRLGQKLRLEQEQIRFSWLQWALARQE